jgi:hypothetical protein
MQPLDTCVEQIAYIQAISWFLCNLLHVGVKWLPIFWKVWSPLEAKNTGLRETQLSSSLKKKLNCACIYATPALIFNFPANNVVIFLPKIGTRYFQAKNEVWRHST